MVAAVKIDHIPKSTMKAIARDTVRFSLDLPQESREKIERLKDLLSSKTGKDCSLQDVIDFAKKIKRLLVITRGDKGAVAINNNEVAECFAKRNLKIKDLTGAGDLFAGGFLHGYINKKSMKESLETGTDMSSKVIQIIGARLNK